MSRVPSRQPTPTTMKPTLACLLFVLVAPLQEASIHHWRAQPDLRLGSWNDLETAFGEVTDVTVSPSGLLYVFDNQVGTIRVFDRDGSYVRSVGQRGDGPGEFRAFGWTGWRGDTLWVQDPALHRITLLADSDRAARTISFTVRDPATRIVGAPGGLLADGSVLVSTSWSYESFGETEPIVVPVMTADRGGTILDTLGWLDQSRRAIRVRPTTGGLVVQRQLIDDSPLVASLSDGSGVLFLDRRVAEGRGYGSFRLRRVSSSGQTLWMREQRYVPKAAGREFFDHLVDAEMERASAALPASVTNQLGRILRERGFRPAFRPPATALLSGDDGTIWVRREEPIGPTVQWMVFDERGYALALVELPSFVNVMWASRRVVVGVLRDELDVQYVVRYSLHADP